MSWKWDNVIDFRNEAESAWWIEPEMTVRCKYLYSEDRSQSYARQGTDKHSIWRQARHKLVWTKRLCAKWCSMRLKDIISKLCLSTSFRPGIFRMKIWGYVRRIRKGGRGSYLGCREKYSEITARKHDDWKISWTDSPHILHIHSLAMYLVVAKAQHSRKAYDPSPENSGPITHFCWGCLRSRWLNRCV